MFGGLAFMLGGHMFCTGWANTDTGHQWITSRGRERKTGETIHAKNRRDPCANSQVTTVAGLMT